MKPLVLYFLLGAIVAVWTAINQVGLEQEPAMDTGGGRMRSLLFAYVLIALAWPISVVVSVYALVSSLLVDNSQ